MSNPSHIVVAHDFSATGEVVAERAIALACESPQKVLHFLVIIDDRHGVAAVPVTSKVRVFATVVVLSAMVWRPRRLCCL